VDPVNQAEKESPQLRTAPAFGFFREGGIIALIIE
jgi:hypothetical protein